VADAADVIKLKVPEQEGETAPKNFFWNLPHALTTELLPDVLDYRNPRLADLGTPSALSPASATAVACPQR